MGKSAYSTSKNRQLPISNFFEILKVSRQITSSSFKTAGKFFISRFFLLPRNEYFALLYAPPSARFLFPSVRRAPVHGN